MKIEPLSADVRAHLRWIRNHVEIALYGEVNLDSAVNYLQGFNAALGYSLFRGFEEWLIVDIGSPSRFAYFWTGLLREAITSGRGLSQDLEIGALAEVDQAFELVDRFLADASDPEATRAFYRRFEDLRTEAGL